MRGGELSRGKRLAAPETLWVGTCHARPGGRRSFSELRLPGRESSQDPVSQARKRRQECQPIFSHGEAPSLMGQVGETQGAPSYTRLLPIPAVCVCEMLSWSPLWDKGKSGVSRGLVGGSVISGTRDSYQKAGERAWRTQVAARPEIRDFDGTSGSSHR